MDRHTSVFLDISRFTAAMVVFVGHTAGHAFSGGLFWQVGRYLETAVMVFFVLSGYVIGYVTDTRETKAKDYAAARLARLYSVVLPALLLTVAADAIGLSANAGFYYNGPWNFGGEHLLGYLATFLYANEFWSWPVAPGSNAPFWSLSYEASYYVLFGLYFFLKGPRKWLWLILAALLVGPSILSRLPIWLMGLGVYHLRKRIRSLPGWVAGAAFILGLALVYASPLIREGTHRWTLPLLRPMLISDYTDGIGFSLVILGFSTLPESIKDWVQSVAAPARYAGSLTFSLYLFHLPLIMLIAALGWFPVDSAPQRMMVFGVPLMAAVLIGRPCERAKIPLKRWFLALFDRWGKSIPHPDKPNAA
ncbi:acyltransferase family protein [Kordiimonas marina]|uniref:acyltransferase family protein n=1 Tax=Kordiimonas marina TaxID=2872312 RepID=UPI001FF5A7D6|nr:acyltransferase [Kordiimonas marina]MCJ9429254.1 acyltransferase [Kordiimonas marina]